jgi:hypothetical protein
MSSSTFVIFAYKDSDFVLKLRHDLEYRGVPTTSAVDIVRPGLDFAAVIQRAIRESRVILVVLSRWATERPWIYTEISFAVALQMSGEGKVLIPVVIEPTVEIPFFLKNLQFIDLSTPERYGQGLSLLVEAVRLAEQDPTIERPEEREQAHRALLEAQRQVLELERKVQLEIRRERAVLLTSAFSTFLGVVVALFGGLVSAGTFKWAWMNVPGAFGFLAGISTTTTVLLIYFLLRKRARSMLDRPRT